MASNKNMLVFLVVVTVFGAAALAGAYTFIDDGVPDESTISDGAYHNIEDIPQGPGSGLDADTVDGMQLDEILAAVSGPGAAKIGCDASNADPSGVNEYPVVCWHSMSPEADDGPLILACVFQQEHGDDASSSATNLGGCLKITDSDVTADNFAEDRVFFNNDGSSSSGNKWIGGDLYGCSVSDSDIGGSHEFGFVCGGSDGFMACTIQMDYEGKTSSLMCINRDWDHEGLID